MSGPAARNRYTSHGQRGRQTFGPSVRRRLRPFNRLCFGRGRATGAAALRRCGTAKAKQINNGRPLKINPQNRPKSELGRRDVGGRSDQVSPVPRFPPPPPPVRRPLRSNRARSPPPLSAPADSWNRPSESCPSLTTGKAPCGPTERERDRLPRDGRSA